MTSVHPTLPFALFFLAFLALPINSLRVGVVGDEDYVDLRNYTAFPTFDGLLTQAQFVDACNRAKSEGIVGTNAGAATVGLAMCTSSTFVGLCINGLNVNEGIARCDNSALCDCPVGLVVHGTTTFGDLCNNGGEFCNNAFDLTNLYDGDGGAENYRKSPAVVVQELLADSSHEAVVLENFGDASQRADFLADIDVFVAVGFEENPPEEAPQELVDFVTEGGSLVWLGVSGFDELFDLENFVDIAYYYGTLEGVSLDKTAEAAGTSFADGPDSVEFVSTGMRVFNETSEGTVCYYKDTETDFCVVMSIPVGSGTVVFLGFDFLARFNNVPAKREKLEDVPNWVAVFDLALSFELPSETSSSSSYTSGEDGISEGSSSTSDGGNSGCSRLASPLLF